MPTNLSMEPMMILVPSLAGTVGPVAGDTCNCSASCGAGAGGSCSCGTNCGSGA